MGFVVDVIEGMIRKRRPAFFVNGRGRAPLVVATEQQNVRQRKGEGRRDRKDLKFTHARRTQIHRQKREPREKKTKKAQDDKKTN